MIAWSKKRADKEKVTERTEFRVPDAEMLPFEDNNFDIVWLCAPASKCNDKPAPTTATGSSLSESDFAQFHPTHNIDESPPDTSPRSTSPHSIRLRIARVDFSGLTSEQKAADREAKGLSYSK